ncbi:RING-type E3 ubiquitin transferase [Ranunculus cassubicifolius]
MNSTYDSTGMLTDRINGIGYFVGISIGIIFLVATITIATVACRRAVSAPYISQRHTADLRADPSIIAVDIGLDETTIQSYPTILYLEAKLDNKENNTSSCCSICLSDYKSTDILRQLPDCEHLFHIKCVDPWLRLHPTCPVCRHTPSPTPMSTPLAEVVPLAHHQV